MRKNGKIILIAVLALVLVCALFACNDNNYTPPDKIGGETGGGSGIIVAPGGQKGTARYLVFTYKDATPSLGTVNYYLDEFGLDKINFQIVYTYTINNKAYEQKGEPQPLLENMLSQDDLALLQTAGLHEITATYKAGNRTVSGKFKVRLEERYNGETVNVTFQLGEGVNTLFGTPVDGKIVKKIPKNKTYAYSDFVSDFRVFKSGSALSGWNAGGTAFNASSASYKFASDVTMSPVWADDTVNISFELNIPSDAAFNGIQAGAEGYAEAISAATPEPQVQARRVGVIERPDSNLFDKTEGWDFAGWRVKGGNGELWSFNKQVGNSDIVLEAVWRVKTFTLTVYLSGGEFDSELIPEQGNNPSGQPQAGETKVESSSDFDVNTGLPLKITFNNLAYGTKYSDYIADAGIFRRHDTNEIVIKALNLASIAEEIDKGGKNFVVDGYYTSPTLEPESLFVLDADTVINDNVSLYIGWKPNESGGDLDKFYSEYLFDYTIKADGTIRIDELNDATLTSLSVPAGFNVTAADGSRQYYPISEIGAGSCQNSPFLLTLDLSQASSLKIIGDSAFAYCGKLKNIVMPENNSLTLIGYRAFYGTSWQNEAEGEYVSINNILVAYMGNSDVTELTIPDGIVTIAAGAFSELKFLKKVTLSASVENILKNAFEKCPSFETIAFGADDGNHQFKNIDAEAFVGTKFLAGAGDTDRNGSIILGNVFYRYVGENSSRTKVVIPASVTIIAADAFAGKSRIADIEFENAMNIVSVGGRAFSDTEWVRIPAGAEGDPVYKTANGFVIINGILTNYVGTEQFASVPTSKDASIRLVKHIADNAFANNYYIKNVDIPAGVTIGTQAFSGATSLTAITYISSENPADIAENAFADRNGVLPVGLNFYFNKNVLDNFKSAAGLSANWISLYKSAESRFRVREVVYTEINPDVIKSKYIKTNADFTLKGSWAADGIMINDVIANGAIEHRSNGVSSVINITVSQLSFDGNADSAGEHKLSVTGYSTYAFTYTIYPAIAGAVPYDPEMPTSNIIDGNADDAAIKPVGLENVYYSTQTKLDLNSATLQYKYYDESDNSVDITEDMITGWDYQQGPHILTITYNYHGLCEYKIKWSYTVENPIEVAISQYGTMSVPMNSNALNHTEGANVRITMSDGTYKLLNLSSGRFTVDRVDNVASETLPTSMLGPHTAHITYKNSMDQTLECDYVYHVILTADVELFTFDYNEQSLTATVKTISANHSPVVVIPTTVVNKNKTYTVTAIGDGVFKNNLILESVVIPTSVLSIGKHAFDGCVNLNSINSYTETEIKSVSEDSILKINEEFWEPMSDTVVFDADLFISKVTDPGNLESIVVPESMVLKAEIQVPNAGKDASYRSNRTYNFAVKLMPDVFKGFEGKIYLPDNEYYREFIEQNKEDKRFELYAAGEMTPTRENHFAYRFAKDAVSEYSYADLKSNLQSAVPTNTVRTVDVKILANAEMDYGANYNKTLFVKENLKVATDANSTTTYKLRGLETGAFSKVANLGARLYLPDTIAYTGVRLSGTSFTPFMYEADKETFFMPSLSFPDSVQTIGEYAFANTIKLGTLDDGLIFSGSGLKSSLSKIEKYAFQNSGIVSIDLSRSLITTINENVFDSCLSLTSVILPSTVTRFANGAFMNCKALQSLTGFDPTAVTYIGFFAFYNCQAFDWQAAFENLSPEAFVGENAFDK